MLKKSFMVFNFTENQVFFFKSLLFPVKGKSLNIDKIWQIIRISADLVQIYEIKAKYIKWRKKLFSIKINHSLHYYVLIITNWSSIVKFCFQIEKCSNFLSAAQRLWAGCCHNQLKSRNLVSWFKILHIFLLCQW